MIGVAGSLVEEAAQARADLVKLMDAGFGDCPDVELDTLPGDALEVEGVAAFGGLPEPCPNVRQEEGVVRQDKDLRRTRTKAMDSITRAGTPAVVHT